MGEDRMTKQVEREALNPHAFGEHLVKALLEGLGDAVGELGYYRLESPKEAIRLRDVFPLLNQKPDAILANARLTDGRKKYRFDPMHGVDVALVCGDEALAIELKLGTTALSLSAFRRRFVDKIAVKSGKVGPFVRPDKPEDGDGAEASGTAQVVEYVEGDMIQILDWDNTKDLEFSLHVCDGLKRRSIRKKWFLMLRRQVWERHWQNGEGLAGLAEALGTKNLAGLLVFEDIARFLPPREAVRIAVELAEESIKKWFPVSGYIQ